ncbi:uncharacterized protein PGTG_03238 [Puccinia graminis f. sp. tritici CRL 75-36-700-3]|uniref:Uncharacterized protein n=1 Tax=Puccinia graminis f. sp. tritici (strain CRL 75-36-700-3 / race SCCL) TaxID=418459 RepID=E3JZ07_PUCGT|nr:uncharacterized protein PGTG_03238 [Puccinia graminis f. sp. tritici CRL 75-36-700-3]EFP77282.1 hypothetical protein PGTG_03238 [Puccinia graminis f. sp. tritici CRL 75-36-700-3]
MSLKDCLQRSLIIYAVICMTLLPSVQLSKLQKRNGRHNCDMQYINVPGSTEDATCIGTDNIKYNCKEGSCTKGFKFLCKHISQPDTGLVGDFTYISPDRYMTGPFYISEHIRTIILGWATCIPKGHRE